MTKLARAVVMSGLTLETREYPVPEPAPGTILLRQELCGVCGTDVHNWEHRRFSYDVAMGHEPVGIVEKLGEGVTADYFGKNLEVGDRVIVAPGTPNGAYGFQVAEEQPYFRSGFADYIYLAIPGTFVYKTGLPASVAVLAEPFTIGVHAAMRARMSFGDTVVVQGSGAIGLMTLACAKLSGAGRLIVVGGPPARLALARRMGADVTIDIGEVRGAEERTKLVWIADRENDRIQIFTSDGQFIREWTDVQRPTQVRIDPEAGLVYVSENWWRTGDTSFVHGPIGEHRYGRVSIFDLSGKLLTRWGGAGTDPMAPGYFSAAHDLAVDSRGDLYVAEVTYAHAVSIGLLPPEAHTFQKFERVE